LRNDRVDIVPEANTGKNIILSTVCFTPTKTLIGTKARNKMMQYPESSMFESQRLIGHKYSNPDVQKDIELMNPLKII
jgi:molecular chaperone DnaK (HSP70)